MSLNFRKSFGLGKIARINISKGGLGVSTGIKGLRVGIGKRGVTKTVSIPGTGIYSRSSSGTGSKSNDKGITYATAFKILLYGFSGLGIIVAFALNPILGIIVLSIIGWAIYSKRKNNRAKAGADQISDPKAN